MPPSKSKKTSKVGLCNGPEFSQFSSALKYLWHIHVQGCMRRDIPNDLPPAHFAIMIKDNCYYCGMPPTNMTKMKYGNISYNGIDRIDNNKGYAPSNLVTCCKDCNSMKSQLSEEKFLAHARRITAYQDSLSKEDRDFRMASRKQIQEALGVAKSKGQPTMFDVFGHINE